MGESIPPNESLPEIPRFFPFSAKPEPIEYYGDGKFHPVHLQDTLQDSRYRILRKLGHGTYSTVWLAKDNNTGSYVAVKICRAKCSVNDETKIYKVIEKTALLSHRGLGHILPLLDHFTLSGPNGRHQVLVYQVTGGTVLDLKRTYFRNSTFPLSMAKSIVWQTLLGLDFLHSNGIGHGDVQWRNLLYMLGDLSSVPETHLTQPKGKRFAPIEQADREGDPKVPRYRVPDAPLIPVLDASRQFRISISDLGGAFPLSSSPRKSIAPLGSRAPETLFQGCVTAKQDLWSFGCLLFELITGRALFDVRIFQTELQDDLHFLAMYSIIGFPQDEKLRNTHWPGWGKYFDAHGRRIDRKDTGALQESNMANSDEHTRSLEGLIVAHAQRCQNFPPEEVQWTIDLMRGLLEFDPEKRFTSQDVMYHPWFAQQRRLL